MFSIGDSLEERVKTIAERVDSMAKSQADLVGRLEAIFGQGAPAKESNGAPNKAKASKSTGRASRESAAPQGGADFLRKCLLFEGLDDEDLAEVASAGRSEKLGPGQLAFRRGDDCRAALVVRSGIVEILRAKKEGSKAEVVALLGPGDLVGEIGVLGGGRHRSSAVAPEGAEILVLTTEVFESLLMRHPSMALAYARDLSARLLGTVKHLDAAGSKVRQLEGSFDFFDPSTLVQSLITSSNRAGTLIIRDAKEEEIGALRFGEGQVQGARFRSLAGCEAFYQLFIEDLHGLRFAFREDEVGVANSEVAYDPTMAQTPGINLLMEAARLADETRLARERGAPGLDQKLRRSAAAFQWAGETDAELPREVWRQVKGRGKTLRELLQTIPACEARIWAVVTRMLQDRTIA